MLLKSLLRYKTIINICQIYPIRTSALFINGPKATENYIFIVPHIDFPERFKEKDILHSMISKRKSNFDIQKLENLWSVYADLLNLKLQEESRKSKLSKELSEILVLKKEGNDVEKLKIQINLIKDNLRNLKNPLWSAEEAAKVEALSLPNLLHKLTPDSQNKVIVDYKILPQNEKNHYLIGTEKNLITFIKNNNYYLIGDAALFELGAKFYFSDYLKRNNFVQFSNPDFVKSLIVEGCGIDHTDPKLTFILHHNDNTVINEDKRLHLTGAGSLCSFLAYHAKNVIYSKVLPLKYFSIGRQYTPSTGNHNLFNVSQSSVVQLFGVAKDKDESDKILNEVVEMIKLIYNNLNYHYKLSYVPADKLYKWESLRISIEMYSASLNKSVEIGHVSLSGDFISKRLMFTYTENRQAKFPHILSGTVLNVPKFLGCILEQDEEFSIPETFKIDNWAQQNKVDTI